MSGIVQLVDHRFRQTFYMTLHSGQWMLVGLMLGFGLGTPALTFANPAVESMTKELA